MERRRLNQIFRADAKGRILSVEDCLDIGKLHFSITTYFPNEPGKESIHVKAFATASDIRGMLGALDNGTFNAMYPDGKTIYGGSREKKEARIVSFKVETLRRGNRAGQEALVVRIVNGPGSITDNGAIRIADGEKTREGVFLLSPAEAQNMAANAIDYLRAWLTRNMGILYDEDGKRISNLAEVRQAKVAQSG